MRCGINQVHHLRRIRLALIIFAYKSSLLGSAAYHRGTGYGFRWRYGRRPDQSESELIIEGNEAVKVAGPLAFLHTLKIHLQELQHHEQDRFHLEERLKRVHRRGKLVLHLIGVDTDVEPRMAWLGALRGRDGATAALWNLTRTTGLPDLLDFRDVSLELVFNIYSPTNAAECCRTFYQEHGEDVAEGAYQSDTVICLGGPYHEAVNALARSPANSSHQQTSAALVFCKTRSDHEQCDTRDHCKTTIDADFSSVLIEIVPDFAMMINAGLGQSHHEDGEDTFRPTLLHLATTAIPTIVTNYAGDDGALERHADSNRTPIIAELLVPAFFAESVQDPSIAPAQEENVPIWWPEAANAWWSPFCDAYVQELRDIPSNVQGRDKGRRVPGQPLPWNTESKTYCVYSSDDVQALRGHGIEPKFLGTLPFVWVDNVLHDGASGFANSDFVVF